MSLLDQLIQYELNLKEIERAEKFFLRPLNLISSASFGHLTDHNIEFVVIDKTVIFGEESSMMLDVLTRPARS